MSIFNRSKAPVEFFRSLFFCVAVLFSILIFPPMISYASEAEENIENEPAAGEGQAADEGETGASGVFSSNIYHKHTGDSEGGGCYTVEMTGTKEVTEACGGPLYYYSGTGTSTCSWCGMNYTGNRSGKTCWYQKTKTVEYIYYDLGCNMSPDTLLGSLTVTQDTTEWTKSLILTGTYEAGDSMEVSDKPFIWNNADVTDSSTYEVTSNGEYTLQLNADSNADTEAAVITVDVRNVDNSAPIINAHILTPESEWTKDGVKVTITNAADIQPDGSAGCGLHEMPYSYDGGESWTAENTHVYLENGTHSILVRDALENASSYDVEFYNIDCFGPTVQAVDYDHTSNIRNVQIAVTAADIQPDGGEGGGLHEKPYSFDGGVTWTSENTLSVNKNGTVKIALRDTLGNIAHFEETISNIDCMGPEISCKTGSDLWTNQSVTLTLKAKDINEDGSEGIGLGASWYSLDNGVTWSGKKEVECDENKTITILARDKYNNRSSRTITIDQIDRKQPWVILSMKVLGSGRNMRVELTAMAGDAQSGLEAEAYSWDNGASYGAENTKMVTENGTYQVFVRDKAGNLQYESVDVDVFPIIHFPAFIMEEENEQELSKEAETIIENVETETKEVVVKQEERIASLPQTVEQELQEDKWDWKDTLILSSSLLLWLGFLIFLLLLWLWTIAVYVEDEDGNMKYMGRLRICYKERFEVKIPAALMEKCMTTHFSLRPSRLFVKLYRNKDICCLFPEELCIIKHVESNIEIYLL